MTMTPVSRFAAALLACAAGTCHAKAAPIDFTSQSGLEATCPRMLDAKPNALARDDDRAAYAICGAISIYNETTAQPGPSNYLSLLINHGTMTGFVYTDYLAEVAAGTAEMAGWYVAGKIQSREHIVDGLETFPDTFLQLFSGENHGKLVIRVAEE